MTIIDSMLKASMDNLRAGRRAEAAKICRDICRMEPKHARAHSLLGMIVFQDGDTDTALELLNYAQHINPNLPDVPRALAEIYLGMEDLDKALEAQSRALYLNPRDPNSHLQVAIIHQRQGNSDKAEEAVRMALKLKADIPGAWQLLAGIAYRDGRIEEARDAMAKSRVGERPAADPNHTLALALLATGRADEIASLSPPVTRGQAFGETVIRAIAAWLENRPDDCRQLIADLRPTIPQVPMEAPNRSVFVTYLSILDGLVDWRDGHADAYAGDAERTVHVIGDSHTLTAANLTLPIDGAMTRLQTHLVFGCKAWHLVREEPSPYRGMFDLALAQIPDGATVMAAFGELDCRLKEGVVRAVRRDTDLDPDRLVDDLVARYVPFMLEAGAARGMTVWFQSPAMSNINMSLVEDEVRDVFLQVIRRFNERLRAETAAHGARLIDVNRVTTADDGSARRGHYIDTNHIRPTALVEAFELAEQGQI
jgi:Flp pilus assembly protein TadD